MSQDTQALATRQASGGNGKWSGAVCVVTGAGSGIGRALSLELARRGAVVHANDVNGASASRVAAEIGGASRGVALDVRDGAAFKSLVDDVVRDAGRVDYLFNNAGIGIGGETHELTIAHWERAIDVNIRGVIHGIAACYPAMVARRGGHIVNTASMAGIIPTPFLAPYTMTKHAVVGLSRALRIEAEGHGVKVSVLCPGATETPILDADNPRDLPPLAWRPNLRRMLERLGGPPYPVNRLAADALDAVERNVGTIVVPGAARVGRLLAAWAPWLVEMQLAKAVAAERADRQHHPKGACSARSVTTSDD